MGMELELRRDLRDEGVVRKANEVKRGNCGRGLR